MMYLALGTGIVWFFILGYVYSIFHKINRVEQKVTEMQANGVISRCLDKGKIKEKKSSGGEG